AQFRSMPVSLLEAAAIDGAGPMRTLLRIVAPASVPALTTLVVLVFMWTWNEFLIALVMAPGGTLRTAPLGLANFQGQYTAELALLSAGAVIVALPMVIMFLFLQRHFIRGMLEGAVK
ncbi:MAG: carbohydrate ABC transporter permease, partial [Brachybacterium tyrofermentans]